VRRQRQRCIWLDYSAPCCLGWTRGDGSRPGDQDHGSEHEGRSTGSGPELALVGWVVGQAWICAKGDQQQAHRAAAAAAVGRQTMVCSMRWPIFIDLSIKGGGPSVGWIAGGGEVQPSSYNPLPTSPRSRSLRFCRRPCMRWVSMEALSSPVFSP